VNFLGRLNLRTLPQLPRLIKEAVEAKSILPYDWQTMFYQASVALSHRARQFCSS
jgi:hypothetical protein